MPIVLPDAGWWHVHDTSGTDGDGLALTNANGGSDFNPGTSPFSFCALIRLNSGAQGYRRVVAKALNVGHYSYDMMTVGSNLSLRCRIWTPTEYGFYITNMFPAYPAGNTTKYLCCFTWEPSIMRGYVCRPPGEGATGTGNIATQAGPVGETSPDDPLALGQTGAGGGGMVDSDIFWFAFWMGEAKSQSFFEDLYNQVTMPYDTNPLCYIDFHQAVAATYDSEIPTDSDYLFDVINTPVHGGSSDPTFEPSYGLVAPHLVYSAAATDPPQVVSAVATAYNKVRVQFDQEVNKSDPGNSNDALNPANYAFTGGLTATSVVLVIPGPTLVEVTVDQEMLGGGTYEVEVSNVTNLFGELINPLYDTAGFTGIGIAPEVSSAAAQDAWTVRVTFNEDMKNNAALTTPANYTFTGSLLASAVVRIDATHVDVTVNEMLQGLFYTVTVNNVEDLAGNAIASPPDNQAWFTGIGDKPQLLPAATPVPGDDKSVYVDYSETVIVADAENASNYSILPTLGALSVAQVTGTRYKVTFTNNVVPLTVYTVEVINVRDLAYNEIDPAHDTASWTAVVPSPPFLYLHPGDGVSNIPPRDYLRVQAVDDPLYGTGIDPATWDIWLNITLSDGSTYSGTVLTDGVAQPGYEVNFIGDADDLTDGIYARFRPTSGHWPENAQIDVYSRVQDDEATESSDNWVCYIGEFSCFEDLESAADSLDTTLINGFASRFPGTDQLRGLLMRACSSSKSQRIQARTLLWYATATDLRTILARLFDLELVQDIRLCDRSTIDSIYQILLRNGPAVLLARQEMLALVGDRTLDPVLKYLVSSSPLHIVSAACSLIVMAATAGSS